MWRSGLALRPYFEDVKYMVENKDEFPHLKGHTIVQRDSLSFVHCPIVDCDVTDDHTVLNLCKQLVEDIHRGEVIYLHCWGGHGRTGTVVSIMLHMMYGVSLFSFFSLFAFSSFHSLTLLLVVLAIS